MSRRAEPKVVTRFEMTRREDLVPARPLPDVRLVEAADPAGEDQDRIRRLHDQLAAPHGWSSLRWPTSTWNHWLRSQDLRHWYIQHGGADIGWGCLRRHGRAEIELDTFGLLPQSIGHGYGGHALTLFIQQAWGQMGTHGLLWLTTTTRDHPHAARNYRARGFRPTATWTPLA